MLKQVGIDAIAVHVPRLFVNLDGEWAQVRANELGEPSVDALVGKVTNGVGVRRMAVPGNRTGSCCSVASSMACGTLAGPPGPARFLRPFGALGCAPRHGPERATAPPRGFREGPHGAPVPDRPT